MSKATLRPIWWMYPAVALGGQCASVRLTAFLFTVACLQSQVRPTPSQRFNRLDN